MSLDLPVLAVQLAVVAHLVRKELSELPVPLVPPVLLAHLD